MRSSCTREASLTREPRAAFRRQRSGGVCQTGLGQEPGRAAGGPPAALGGVGDQQPVLGAGGGDVEQPAFLGQTLRIGR